VSKSQVPLSNSPFAATFGNLENLAYNALSPVAAVPLRCARAGLIRKSLPFPPLIYADCF
jgi:hypothetical protein